MQGRGVLHFLRLTIKKGVRNLPIAGWMLQLLRCVFIERKKESAMASLHDACAEFDEAPIILSLYPEGTRFSHEKLLRSQQFARERGLYVPKHTLVPRVTGFVELLEITRSRLHALYDATLVYIGPPGSNLNAWSVMSGRSFGCRVCLEIVRVDRERIPANRSMAEAYIRKSFYDKDEFLDCTSPQEVYQLEGLYQYDHMMI